MAFLKYNVYASIARLFRGIVYYGRYVVASGYVLFHVRAGFLLQCHGLGARTLDIVKYFIAVIEELTACRAMLHLRSPIGQTDCREVKQGIVFLVLELIVLAQELGFYVANQDIPTLLEGTTLLFRFVVVSGYPKLAGVRVRTVAVVSLPGEVSVALEASRPIAAS